MLFKNVERLEGGNVKFAVEANQEEVAFLVNYAVNRLLASGIISLTDEAEQSVELSKTPASHLN